jgi:hypothetical protein
MTSVLDVNGGSAVGAVFSSAAGMGSGWGLVMRSVVVAVAVRLGTLAMKGCSGLASLVNRMWREIAAGMSGWRWSGRGRLVVGVGWEMGSGDTSDWARWTNTWAMSCPSWLGLAVAVDGWEVFSVCSVGTVVAGLLGCCSL